MSNAITSLASLSSLSSPSQAAEIRAPHPTKNPDEAIKAAKKFEATFISDFIQHLFKGVSETEGMFGGGQMEGMFRSVWAEKIAESMTNPGFGIAESILPTLLKDQEESRV